MLSESTSIAGAISIHAAREGGDRVRNPRVLRRFISIHAAREGGDFVDDAIAADGRDFNPRRP